jgi:phosphotriesterase-related protein
LNQKRIELSIYLYFKTVIVSFIIFKYMKKIFISLVTAVLVISCNSSQQNTSDQEGFIYSVHGKMDISELGIALTHEHVMSQFGADPAYVGEYDKELLFKQVIPYLKEVKALGIQTIFDCTTAYFGRNVNLLKEMADSTGIEIVTNTGYYAAAKDRYVPESAYESTSEEIAEIWIDEYENGIDDTGIRPGFIKLAYDNGEPSDIDSKLFVAGIHAHLKTGLTMAVHTGDNPQALYKQLQLLDEYGVSPSAWIWVHASNTKSDSLLLAVAETGAWISLDKFKAPQVEDYISRISLLKEKGFLDQILLSHDGNSFPRGGDIRGYQAVITDLVPALKESGFSEEEVNQMLVENPQNAFRISVRKKG